MNLTRRLFLFPFTLLRSSTTVEPTSALHPDPASVPRPTSRSLTCRRGEIEEPHRVATDKPATPQVLRALF